MLYLTFRTIFRGLFFVLFRLQTTGMDHIPKQGPVIICCNHISLMDPPVLGTPLKRRIYYMAKAELFSVPLIGFIIRNLGAFPVKRGGVSKESIKLAIQLLKEGNMMGIFPQGSRSNTSGMGKKGAAMLALKSNAVVIPAAIIGDYRPFRKMTVYYGSPVDLSEFTGGSNDLEAATEKIMSAIESLKNESK